MAYIQTVLVGVDVDLGDSNSIVTIIAEPNSESVELECRAINIVPIYEEGGWTDVNNRKYSRPLIRLSGTLEIRKLGYKDGTLDPHDYYVFMKAMNKDFLYLNSIDYKMGMDASDGYRIVITDMQHELLGGGSIKNMRFSFEYGGPI